MIFTRAKFNNLYCFDGAEIDLSFPSKPVNSTIEGEFLEKRPNFNYKKVCILTGANASGKTKLGKLLFAIQLMIQYRFSLTDPLIEAICNKSKTASFEIDCVSVLDLKAHRFIVEIEHNEGVKSIVYANTKIGKNDSCQTVRNKLDQFVFNKKAKRGSIYLDSRDKTLDYYGLLDKHIAILRNELSWYYLFTNSSSEKITLEKHVDYLTDELLGKILTTIDSSIAKVKANKPEEVVTGYTVFFENGDNLTIDTSGDFTGKERLSTGTVHAIALSTFVARIICDYKKSLFASVYFLDERMAFLHSELEQYLVNLIIEKLPRHAQFFYTTHNYDVLDMNLPTHSYTFLRKNKDKTEFVEATSIKKKNDRSLLNYVKANMYETLPSTELLDELLWEEE